MPLEGIRLVAMWLRTFGAAVPAGEGPGRKPDAPGGHQARSEVRSTASRAAVRGLVAPDEVRGPQWVGCGDGVEDVWPVDGGRWVVMG